MTRARRELVDPDTTSCYHCICRCVRRAFLCGEDSFSGKSYEHRKGRVVERLRALQKVFAVELCAYAIMPNHYHLVVRLNSGAGARVERGRGHHALETPLFFPASFGEPVCR